MSHERDNVDYDEETDGEDTCDNNIGNDDNNTNHISTWQCHNCSYQNILSSMQCGICQSFRQLTEKSTFLESKENDNNQEQNQQQQQNEQQLAQQNEQQLEQQNDYYHYQELNDHDSEPLQVQREAGGKNWYCKDCGMENSGNDITCERCTPVNDTIVENKVNEEENDLQLVDVMDDDEHNVDVNDYNQSNQNEYENDNYSDQCMENNGNDQLLNQWNNQDQENLPNNPENDITFDPNEHYDRRYEQGQHASQLWDNADGSLKTPDGYYIPKNPDANMNFINDNEVEYRNDYLHAAVDPVMPASAAAAAAAEYPHFLSNDVSQPEIKAPAAVAVAAVNNDEKKQEFILNENEISFLDEDGDDEDDDNDNDNDDNEEEEDEDDDDDDDYKEEQAIASEPAKSHEKLIQWKGHRKTNKHRSGILTINQKARLLAGVYSIPFSAAREALIVCNGNWQAANKVMATKKKQALKKHTLTKASEKRIIKDIKNNNKNNNNNQFRERKGKTSQGINFEADSFKQGSANFTYNYGNGNGTVIHKHSKVEDDDNNDNANI